MDVTGRDRPDGHPAEPDLQTAEPDGNPAEPDGYPAEPDVLTVEPDGHPAEPGIEQAQPPRRPLPGPSPTSRARRVAAAGAPVRRPSPRPQAGPETVADPVPAAATAEPAQAEPAAAGSTAADPEPAKAQAPAGTEPGTELGLPHPGQAPLWLVLLLGLLVLAAGAAVVLAATLPARSGSTGERDRALAAAKSEVPLILSYDYASFDADLAKAKSQLTGRAASDYVTAMTRTIKPAAIKVKAVVQAQTDGAGVESVSPDGRQVTAVVFGEQKVSNSSLSAPRTDLFRVRATLDLVGGRWLISKFDQI
jgi:Mce-associated membrane protein